MKVAGSPATPPPGFYDAGVYEGAAAPQGPAPQGPAPQGPAPQGPAAPQDAGAPDGNATAAYDMGTPYEPGTSYEQPGNPYETGVPYEAGATSAMPPHFGGPDGPQFDGPDGPQFDGPDAPHFGGPDAPLAPDFEGMRRKPRGSNKRVIRFAAVAAAVAVVGGGGVAWAVSGGSGAKPQASSQAQAQVPPPAPLTDAQRKDIEAQRQKELKKRASRAARDEVVRPKLFAKGTPPPTPKPTDPAAGGAGDPVPVGEAQQIARGMLSGFGWSPSSQFGCLVNLWNRESGWNTHASNPSGAYGIPQALPGSKMSSAGPDWQNNAQTQIKWGLGYIKSRYSSPCGAWSHSQSTGWY